MLLDLVQGVIGRALPDSGKAIAQLPRACRLIESILR